MENSARAVIAGKSHPIRIVACDGDHSLCYPTSWQEDSQVSWGALPLAILIRRALWMQSIKVSLLVKREGEKGGECNYLVGQTNVFG